MFFWICVILGSIVGLFLIACCLEGIILSHYKTKLYKRFLINLQWFESNISENDFSTSERRTVFKTKVNYGELTSGTDDNEGITLVLNKLKIYFYRRDSACQYHRKKLFKLFDNCLKNAELSEQFKRNLTYNYEASDFTRILARIKNGDDSDKLALKKFHFFFSMELLPTFNKIVEEIRREHSIYLEYLSKYEDI